MTSSEDLDLSPEEAFVNAGGHLHCLYCYSFIRCSQMEQEEQSNDETCPIITCVQDCGAVFHCCKEQEHNLLCPKLQVPCLNRDYGCQVFMRREQLNSHLERCPASVVVCMAEWNRWPVYSRERVGGRGTMRTKNPYATQGQLDFDLALRDERMLNNFGRALSRKTRMALRNNLTKRHPAVPLAEPIMRALQQNGQKQESSRSDCLDLGDFGEVKGIRMDVNLTRQMQIWQEELDERIKDHEKPPSYWDFPEREKGNIHKHCAYCLDINCQRTYDAADPEDDRACNVVECRWKCGATFHHCKIIEHKMICPKYEEEDEFAWMRRGLKSSEFRPSPTKTKKELETAIDKGDCLLVGPGEPASRSVRKVGTAFVPVPPPMPKTVQKACRLDIRVEAVTRLQTKPKTMYTFVCGQEFRRDEYANHSKTVHNDILGGLNNWIEQRCPMATYGCHFSVRRMHPCSQARTVRFSEISESFGIVLSAEEETARKGGRIERKRKAAKTDGNCRPSLLEMPVEILFSIFSRLDSFSLWNLAVTSKRLREVVCSLLDQRGCVALQWERIKEEGKRVRWEVAFKRWFFSSALDPVNQWTFSAMEGAVANHLKKCPFNVRNRPTKLKKCKEWDAVLTSLKNQVKFRQKMN